MAVNVNLVVKILVKIALIVVPGFSSCLQLPANAYCEGGTVGFLSSIWVPVTYVDPTLALAELQSFGYLENELEDDSFSASLNTHTYTHAYTHVNIYYIYYIY